MNIPSPKYEELPPPGMGPRVVERDAAGHLVDEVACRRCGYNLRGLSIDGRCPECGTAVGWSVHGDLLRYSDPDWVQHQASGLLWLIVSIFLQIAVAFVGSAVDGMTGNNIASTLGATAASAVGLVGYWKVTMPDPGRAASPAIATLPRATRVLAIAGAVASPVLLVPTVAGPGARSIAIASAALYGALALAGLVATLLLFIVLRRLALRIPDDGLAGQTRFVMWGFVSCYGAMIVGVMLFGIIAVSSFSSGGGGAGGGGGSGLAGLAISVLLLGCAVLIALLVFAIWWIVLLFLYRSALVKAATTARETWMRHSA